MVKPIESQYYKVRIYMPGGVIHVLSRTQPVMVGDCDNERWVLDVVEGTNDGDTIGLIKWDFVQAVSWRPPVGETQSVIQPMTRPIFSL